MSQPVQKANVEALIELTRIVPTIRPSMIRQLQRTSPNTTCYFISEDVVHKPVVENASEIAFKHRPVVSWLVPNTKQPGKPIEFCFSVKEVQRFIHAQRGHDIPMFQKELMQSIVGEDVTINETMPREFRFVFEEFEMLPLGQETLKEDRVTLVAIDVVEKYVETKNAENIEESAKSYAGHFWKITKQYLKKTGQTIAAFVLGNPWWVTVVKFLSKVLRVALCAASSVVESALDGRKKLLQMLKETLKRQMGYLAKGSVMIIEIAQSILPIVTQTANTIENAAISNEVQSYSLFGTLQTLIRTYLHNILDVSGMSFVMRLPKFIFVDSSDMFRQVLGDGRLQPNTLSFFSGMDYEILATVFLMDMIMKVFGKTSAKFVLFVFQQLPESDATKAILDKSLSLVDKGSFAWFHVMQIMLRSKSKELVKTGQELLRRVYFWLLDLVPCMFHYFVRNLRSFLALGITTTPQNNASCCLRDVVLNLQKEAVIYEDERGTAEEAHAAKQLASHQNKAQKEQSWFDYLLRRPFRIDEKTTERNKTFAKDLIAQQEWSEIALDLGNTPEQKQEQEAERFSGETHTMKEEDRRSQQEPLWVAQCSNDDATDLFPNAVSVFHSKLPFHFQMHALRKHQWCVVPETNAIRSMYPRSVWTWKGQNYVLLHKVPQDFVRHMATMRTPIFALSVTT